MSDTYFCPYVQGFPAVIEAAVSHLGLGRERLLEPTFDRRLPEDEQVALLHHTLGPAFGVGRARVRQALRAACEAQQHFETRCQAAGSRAVETLARDRKRGIVLIGRPYNLMDPGANLDLPRKIAEMGFPVLPIDLLPFEPEKLPDRYRNVYWAYGQRILSAMQFVRERDDLFAVYFTNFNCGPDSFLVSYAEEIMGAKPMLCLELDEHGADAGYITRIEAFLDVVQHWHPAAPRASEAARLESTPTDLHARRIWIPPMHPVSSELFAAAFRGEGYDAVALPVETRDDLEHGQRLTRGCECLPMRSTIGCFMNTIQSPEQRDQEHALFMPTARGPCRFGQYATLDRLILERSEHREVPLLSPSGDNAYCGLPSSLRRTLWKALLAADVIAKLACRIRPYEATRGDADAALERWQREACAALENQRDVLEAVRRAGIDFARVPVRPLRKPLVGLVGEIYVRNNPFSNEDLVRSVERAGGEAWPAPIPEWILFTTWQDAYRNEPRPHNPKQVLERTGRRLRLRIMQNTEMTFTRAAGPVLADRHEPRIGETVDAGQRYIPFNVGGETLISLGRAVHFVRQGASLIVNASPFGCMPGTIAAGIFSRFERDAGIPVLNLFYEGTGGVNRHLEVFLANLEGRGARSAAPRCNPKAKERTRSSLGSPSASLVP